MGNLFKIILLLLVATTCFAADGDPLLEVDPVTPANLQTVTDGSNADALHVHTGSGISGIDISDDTNLAVTAPVVLTDDTLSLASNVVLEADVDDTPVDAATTDPISSNWAYDHADTSLDPHTQYSRTDGTRAYTGTGAGFRDEDNMASDDATAVASQQSIKAYVDTAIAGVGGGGWTDDGTTIRLDTSTDDVAIGSATAKGKLRVVGDTDKSQFYITANGTQNNANPLFVLEDSGGTLLTSLHSDNQNNVFLGTDAGKVNTVGAGFLGKYNVFLGAYAGQANTDGNRNVFIGHSAGYSDTTGYNNLYLGYFTGYTGTTAYGNTAVGSYSGYSLTSGYRNLFFGSEAGYTTSTGYANVIMGYDAGYLNTTGYGNTFIGYTAGYTNDTGIRNLYIGGAAGYNSDASNNTFLGYQAGYTNTSGYGDIFIGYQTGYKNTTGFRSTFVGQSAGYSNTTANYNVFIGYVAGYYNTTGYGNNYLGYNAGFYNSTGNFNTVIGREAVVGSSGQNASGITAVGYKAGTALRGNNNTLYGYQAGDVLTTGTGNLIIGYNIDPSGATATDELNIGDTIKGDLSTGIGGFVGGLELTERSSDPGDPVEGKSVIWQSDGTGSGDDGDIMIKITAGGSTKTGTLVDFSAL